MTAVSVVSDSHFLGAENSMNLFVLAKNNEAVSDEERERLDVVAEYHLGDLVNRLRPGALAAPINDAHSFPSTLFATVAGSIGIIAHLDDAHFTFFRSVQDAVRKHSTRGVFSHQDYRRFENERRHASDAGFIDGDLVESLLAADASLQSVVAKEVGCTTQELLMRIELLARSLH